MTRIVLDPKDLKRGADHIAEASVAYSKIASSLQQRELPEMPSTLAAAVASGLSNAAQRLDDLASRLEASALSLQERAAAVEGDVTEDMLLELSRDLND